MNPISSVLLQLDACSPAVCSPAVCIHTRFEGSVCTDSIAGVASFAPIAGVALFVPLLFWGQTF